MKHLMTSTDLNSHFSCRLNLALKLAGSKTALAKGAGVRYLTVLSWFKGSKPSLESYVKVEKFINLMRKGGKK